MKTINLGCIQDPLLKTDWCLEFNKNSWIPLSIIIIIFSIYLLGKFQEWW